MLRDFKSDRFNNLKQLRTRSNFDKILDPRTKKKGNHLNEFKCKSDVNNYLLLTSKKFLDINSIRLYYTNLDQGIFSHDNSIKHKEMVYNLKSFVLNNNNSTRSKSHNYFSKNDSPKKRRCSNFKRVNFIGECNKIKKLEDMIEETCKVTLMQKRKAPFNFKTQIFGGAFNHEKKKC